MSGSGGKKGGIGVLGGSFNPIHNGHLHIAQAVRESFGLAEVHFVVATTPPHKEGRSLLPLAHRYAMVCLATSGTRAFLPSLVELAPPASPYSIDTLEKLARLLPAAGRDLFFIAGMDSLLELHTWKENQALLQTYSFVFVARPGIVPLPAGQILPPGAARRLVDLRGLSPRAQRQALRDCRASPANRIYLADMGAPDISASTIRQRARAGRRFGHLVPPPVGAYIRKLNLYGE